VEVGDAGGYVEVVVVEAWVDGSWAGRGGGGEEGFDWLDFFCGKGCEVGDLGVGEVFAEERAVHVRDLPEQVV